jgi:hypothetical protein
MFRENLLPASFPSALADFMLGLFFGSKDNVDMFLRNVEALSELHGVTTQMTGPFVMEPGSLVALYNNEKLNDATVITMQLSYIILNFEQIILMRFILIVLY